MCNNVALDVTKLIQHLIKTATCSCTIENIIHAHKKNGERGREGEGERRSVCVPW